MNVLQPLQIFQTISKSVKVWIVVILLDQAGHQFSEACTTPERVSKLSHDLVVDGFPVSQSLY